jgi:hypothetical protein
MRCVFITITDSRAQDQTGERENRRREKRDSPDVDELLPFSFLILAAKAT